MLLLVYASDPPVTRLSPAVVLISCEDLSHAHYIIKLNYQTQIMTKQQVKCMNQL